MWVQPSLLHKAHIRIGKHAAIGTHSASVGAETATVVVVPEDALGNEAAPVGSHIGQTTQFLYEATSEALYQHDEHIRAPGAKQGILNILGILWIKAGKGLGTLLLAQIIEAAGWFGGPGKGGDKGIY